MMKTSLLSIILVLFSGSLFAADNANKAPQFRDLDTNKDGFVNSTEAKAWSDLQAVFPHIDLNEDGKIDKSEFAALQANTAE